MHLGVEFLVVSSTRSFGPVHRGIGSAQKVIRRRVFAGTEGDADTRRYVNLPAVEPERFLERVLKPLRND
jgi:hypothetical protein